MILAEPPRTRFDLHFNLLGFPVRIHPLYWVLTVLLGLGGRENTPASSVLIWVAVVFVSILVHELGHALMIRRFGRRARIVLYHFGGLAITEEEHSYLPAYEEHESDTKRQILISLAGPGAGFVLAAVVIGVLLAIPSVSFSVHWDSGQLIGWDIGITNERVWYLLQYTLFVNVFWGLINLLPVYPLDGGQVARELFSIKNPRAGIENSLLLSTVVGGIVAGIAILYYFGQGEYRHGIFLGLMFGILAFGSYRMLQQLRSGYGHGDSGGYDDGDWWKR